MEKVLTGWPGHKSLVPPEAKPYIKCHDELTVQNGILFKSNKIIIPVPLKKEMDDPEST